MTINRKYATLYLLLNGRTEIDTALIKRTLSPFLDMDFETISNPVIYASIVPTSPDPDTVEGNVVTNGPFRGKYLFNGDRIVAIKWNLMYKGGAEIPESVLGNFRQTYRNSIAPALAKNLGMESIDISFRHYGEPILEDKGMPPTPILYTDTPVAPRRKSTTIVLDPIVITPTPKTDNSLFIFLGAVAGIWLLRRVM